MTTKFRDQPAELELPGVQNTAGVVFGRIRDYLAGRHLGATRDSALLDQVLICLFAKIYIVQHDTIPANRSLKQQYTTAVERLGRLLGPGYLPTGNANLDVSSLEFVDHQLSSLDFAAGDLVGDAYQCFRGEELRGQEGQFFTPLAAIRPLVDFIDPRPDESIVDPACGAGGFLFSAAQHLLSRRVPARGVAKSIFGVEKDEYLARIARMRIALVTLSRVNVSVGDSLAWRTAEKASFMNRLTPGAYDAVLTNPPFGTKIVSASDAVRRTFKLAHRWVEDMSGALKPTDELVPGTPPQVLFVERCLSLVKHGGRVGMVVPESMISGKNYRHVVEHLLREAEIEAVIGMPEALFKTSGRGGTHTKTALLVFRRTSGGGQRSSPPIFMAEAAWCGHDSRGRPIPNDDTTAIIRQGHLWRTGATDFIPSPLGYLLQRDQIRDRILAPRAYDPEIPRLLGALQATHYLLRFGDLLDRGLVAMTTGDEIGKLSYGTGDIPFVRTSDLSNWEIKLDPKHGVSRGIYNALQRKQDVQAGDILMVRDGTYLIGTCAMITKHDAEMLFQSHLFKIRVAPNDLLDNYLLLALLSSPIVQRQIKAEVQAQDIINSLGARIRNLVLPVPRHSETRRSASQVVERIIRERAEGREAARDIAERVAAVNPRTD